jgi:hypothetical protein
MMNERIKELAEQCWINDGGPDSYFSQQKFAELIVRECIEQVRGIDTLRGTNDDMIYGADIAALRIAKHFGID